MGISFRLVLSFNVIIQDSCTWYIPGSNATRSTIAYMWCWCNILYTFQSEKKNWRLHPTCNSQRSEYNSYRTGRRRITIMSTIEKDNDTKSNRQDFLLKLTTQLQNHFRTKSWDVKKKHFWEDCGSVCCMYVSMADVIFGIDNYAISSLIVIVCKLLAVQIGLQSNEQFELDYKTESSFRKMLPANLWFNQTQG